MVKILGNKKKCFQRSESLKFNGHWARLQAPGASTLHCRITNIGCLALRAYLFADLLGKEGVEKLRDEATQI